MLFQSSEEYRYEPVLQTKDIDWQTSLWKLLGNLQKFDYSTIEARKIVK